MENTDFRRLATMMIEIKNLVSGFDEFQNRNYNFMTNSSAKRKAAELKKRWEQSQTEEEIDEIFKELMEA